jgi:hypothetical protein
MFKFAQRPCRAAALQLDLWRCRARDRSRRLARAWRYLTDRLSADDAQTIMLDCRHDAGWHPLLILTVDDTLEQARETFAAHPELPRLVADGCARVGAKWESCNDELFETRCWAIEVAERYAAEEGITLIRLDENAGALAGGPDANGGTP